MEELSESQYCDILEDEEITDAGNINLEGADISLMMDKGDDVFFLVSSCSGKYAKISVL